MTRFGVSKKKKSPRATKFSHVKKELKHATEQLESYKRELAEATEPETATGEILRVIASSPTDRQRSIANFRVSKTINNASAREPRSSRRC
jgi:hypothetical protein